MTTLPTVASCDRTWCTRPHDDFDNYHESNTFDVHTTHEPVEVTLSHDTAADPEILIDIRTSRDRILLDPDDAADLADTIRGLLREVGR